MDYRREIDGLRALAVTSVILFHAGINSFSGGYVGVDVFFVISGYLITALTMPEIEKGSFSIIKFYDRRARRLLPALFVVLACCIPFSWLWHFPKEMAAFCNSIISTITFSSNILFWQESNYFDTATELKPLLHTWSLSLEEQYYLVYPVILLTLWRFGKRQVVAALAAAAVLSLFMAQWGVQNKPEAAFYLLPTRAWELLVGALAAIVLANKNSLTANKSVCELASGVGCAAIAYSIIAFDQATPFPGLAALPPTLGTALIIIFGSQHTVVGRLLGNRFLVGIGLISYSAYLWHQPIFAFAKQRIIGGVDSGMMLGLTALTLVLAYLTWRFVEQPARLKNPLSGKQILLLTGFGALALGSFGLAGGQTGGFPGRMPASLPLADDEIPKVDNGWCFYSIDSITTLAYGKDGLNCWLGAPKGKVKVLLFGDSFAGHYEPMLDAVGKLNNISIHSITTNWCHPSDDKEFVGPMSSRAYQQCLFNRKYLQESMGGYDAIIFAGMWSDVADHGMLRGVYSVMAKASQSGRPVLILSMPKQYDSNPTAAYKKSLLFEEAFDVTRISNAKDLGATAANDLLEDFAAKHKNLVFFDRQSIFGGRETSDEGRPYSLEGWHLSIFGSTQASRSFVKSESFKHFLNSIRTEHPSNSAQSSPVLHSAD